MPVEQRFKKDEELPQYIREAQSATDLFKVLRKLQDEGRELSGQEEVKMTRLSRDAERELIVLEGENINDVRHHVQDILTDLHHLVHGEPTKPSEAKESEVISSVRTSPLAKAAPEKTRITLLGDQLKGLFDSLEDGIKSLPDIKRKDDRGLIELTRNLLMRLESTKDIERAINNAKRAKKEIQDLADIMGIPLDMDKIDEIDTGIESLEAEKRMQEAMNKVDAVIEDLPPEERDEFLRRLLKKVEDEIPPESEEIPISVAG